MHAVQWVFEEAVWNTQMWIVCSLTDLLIENAVMYVYPLLKPVLLCVLNVL